MEEIGKRMWQDIGSQLQNKIALTKVQVERNQEPRPFLCIHRCSFGLLYDNEHYYAEYKPHNKKWTIQVGVNPNQFNYTVDINDYINMFINQA